MSNFVLSCCSTADLKKEHFEKRGIEYICFHYQLDGVEYPDDLGESVSYKDFYADAAFTHYSDKPLDLKQVVNTNKCLVHIDAFDNKLLVTSCIDNLLKGAVGQAVQNMNLMFGIDETAGLRLKASAF